MRGPTSVKFCTMVSTRPNFIMPVQNFGGLKVGVLTQVKLLGALPSLKFGRAKNVQKSVRFTTTFEFERKYPKKFCEITSTMNKVISAHVDLP